MFLTVLLQTSMTRGQERTGVGLLSNGNLEVTLGRWEEEPGTLMGAFREPPVVVTGANGLTALTPESSALWCRSLVSSLRFSVGQLFVVLVFL